MPFQYDPPYDSPIEELLAWNLDKYIGDDVVFDKQAEVVTPFATFRIDLVARTPGGWRVGFECDGKEFHQDWMRDEFRDCLILGNKAVDVIYRFRGQDLHYHVEDCIYAACHQDSAIFSPKGKWNLELLSSEQAKAALDYDPILGYGLVTIYYVDLKRRLEHSVRITRRAAKDDSRLIRQYMSFAGRFPGAKFGELVSLLRSNQDARLDTAATSGEAF